MEENKIKKIVDSEHFSLLEKIEIIMAFNGMKSCMRTVVPINMYDSVAKELHEIGLKHINRRITGRISLDKGKGGWSNMYSENGPEYNAFIVYIGLEGSILEDALGYEERCENRKFGNLLGYPPCCIDFYLRNVEKANNIQGDLIPFTIDQSVPGKQWDSSLNIIVRYFGLSLISHFPCSLHCRPSIQIAQNARRILDKHFNPDDYNECLLRMNSPALYTEYKGIFIFRSFRFRDKEIQYDNRRIESTIHDNALYHLLRKGNRISFEELYDIKIFQNETLLKRIKNKNYRFLQFGNDQSNQ